MCIRICQVCPRSTPINETWSIWRDITSWAGRATTCPGPRAMTARRRTFLRLTLRPGNNGTEINSKSITTRSNPAWSRKTMRRWTCQCPQSSTRTRNHPKRFLEKINRLKVFRKWETITIAYRKSRRSTPSPSMLNNSKKSRLHYR